MIIRDIYSKLQKYMEKKQILALIGSRQVGKTTLMKQLFKEFTADEKFLNFEHFDVRKLFEDNIEEFIRQYVLHKKYLFIDEFQYAKEGGQRLKYIYDTYPIKIVISGSSKPELAIHSLQYLVGRVRLIEIFPLSFKEFLQFKQPSLQVNFSTEISNSMIPLIESNFEEYLQYGGYPEVVLEKDFKEKEEILKDIVNTYLLKEIKDILQFKKSYEFENTLQKVSIQDGQLLNKHLFSKELSINKNSISQIFNVLEQTYILGFCRPYLNKKSKELIKSPKVYLQDLGFKNSLLNNFNVLTLRQDKGSIYENFVFNQALRLNSKFQFFNEKNTHEMDFVYEVGGEIYGFEVKSSIHTDQLNKSVIHFIEKYNPKEVIIFNSNFNKTTVYNNTKIKFTHYINSIAILGNLNNINL